ncbi:MAG: HEPN domain-containing protein [Anaerolineales bacterium]|nr:HEPN domain-containing protein [Anaerolineales bacterium]
MSEANNPLAWATRAEEDFIMARLALRQKPPLSYSACFHAQQCAEKYLKALLVSKGVAFPRTHDLLLLQTLCEQASIFVAVNEKDLNTLSDYAVRVRYPGEDPIPEEAKEALEIAKATRKFSKQFLGLK